jgi:hypothetical protein
MKSYEVLLEFPKEIYLTDQFVSSWYNDIENSSRGQFYGSFKKDFGLENYLVRLNMNNDNL